MPTGDDCPVRSPAEGASGPRTPARPRVWGGARFRPCESPRWPSRSSSGQVLLVMRVGGRELVVQVARKPTEMFARQRLAGQGAGGDLAAIRSALRRALHGGDHTGTAGRSGPGGEQRQPGGAELLALAIQLEPVRAVPTGVERRRDVSAHRWTFAEARRYCIHDHIVVEDGPWHDPPRAGSTHLTPAWCPLMPWR